MKRRHVTAAELMERLNANPDYVARKKAQDEAIHRRAEDYARAEAPLVQALNAVGVPVSSVWDLVNAGRKRPSRTFRISTDPPEAVWDWLDANGGSYASVLALLLDHLQRPYPDAVRGGIARALAIPEAKFAWPLLVKLYRQEQGQWTRDGLAVALANIAEDDQLDELINLARDPRNGESRVLLLDALRRSLLPLARRALVEFGADPFLQREAQRILNQSKEELS